MTGWNVSRRRFLRRCAVGSVAVSGLMLGGRASHAAAGEREMTICLVPGAIGVQADQMETVRLAGRFGFESVGAQSGALAGFSREDMEALKKAMAERDLVFGVAGLPVDFRGGEEKFREGLDRLPKIARSLRDAGVTRVGTWIMPCHDELTYLQNFDRHVRRLTEVAKILEGHSLRLGFEYVGTQTLRTSRKYPFIHTMAETMELIEAIGIGNCGLVLDSWHWWTAQDTVTEILSLKNRDVVSVDLNDAPAGVPREEVIDGRRELPASTGVIDIGAFLGALREIGYDGPVRAEPFNQELNDMDNETACATTINAMKRAFAKTKSVSR